MDLFACFKPRPSRPSLAAVNSSIAHRHSSIASITGLPTNSSPFSLGVLLYPSLLLTTHQSIPSPSAVSDAQISLRYSQNSLNILRRRFLPDLFFVTDAELNLTVIACEFVTPEMRPLGLDTTKVDEKAFTVGNKVYVLGYDRNQGEPCKFAVGSGYIVTVMGDCIELRSREQAWMGGSAGFDLNGNFAFIVTDCESYETVPFKSKAVTIQGVRKWLEPQWRAPKTEAPRPRAPIMYTRRATYAGPESVSTDLSPDDSRANKRVDITSSEHPSDARMKDLSIRFVDVTSGKAPIVNVKKESYERDEDTFAMEVPYVELQKPKTDHSGGTSSVLERARLSASETEATVSLRNPKLDKNKKPFQTREPVAVRGRTKPSLQSKFQRDRRSLQVRLADLHKEKS